MQSQHCIESCNHLKARKFTNFFFGNELTRDLRNIQYLFFPITIASDLISQSLMSASVFIAQCQYYASILK